MIMTLTRSRDIHHVTENSMSSCHSNIARPTNAAAYVITTMMDDDELQREA